MDRTLALTFFVLASLLALTLALAPRAQAQETQMAEFWGWLGVTQPQKAQAQARALDQAWEEALMGALEEVETRLARVQAQYAKALAQRAWGLAQAQAGELAVYREEKSRLTQDIGKARATQGRAIIWPW
ncbi:MAG: hypothetical protein WC291_02645 [Thermodesulfovibrionales bacterium]|jgi:hypothetical protein